MKPLISVVIPLFNAERFIAATLTCLEQQTLKAFEAIIIDDGSCDGSAGCVDAFVARDPRFTLVRQDNTGVSVTRNRGVALARADVVAFLDADDLWHPTFLERMLSFMNQRADVSIGHAGVRFVDRDGIPTGNYARSHTRPLTIADLLAGNPTTTCSNLVVRREEFLASGGFKISLNHAEDQLWLLVMHLHGHIISGLPDVLVDYRANDAGLSADTRAMGRGWEELAGHALQLDPKRVRPALPSARAANRLYLAQRALRTRGDIKTALHHGALALRSHAPTVLSEATRYAAKAANRILKRV